MIDVTALGEILIDFTPQGKDEHNNPNFTANPGGAPGNVMVALSRLGKKTAFIGSVGRDQFGEMLTDTLKENGVQVEGMVYTDTPTTLAFVHIAEDGDRSFSFYRKPGADLMLTKEDLKLELIKQSNIFHIGSLSLTNNPVREATMAAVHFAKENGVLISYDPNLRPALWNDLQEAKKWIVTILPLANIVKLSDEEIEFLTGEKDIPTAANNLLAQYPIPVLFVTLGAKGSYCFSGGNSAYVPGLTINAIDTTGCGDAFFAGVLYQMIEKRILGTTIDKHDMEDILYFGNALGGLVATNRGAIPAMPTLNELKEFIKYKSE